MRRHALALLGLLAVWWAGQVVSAGLGAAPPRTVWLVLRGAPGAALQQVLAAPDTRLVRAWWGGRVVQLDTGAQGAAALPPGAAWLRWAPASALWRLPGCG